MSENLATYVLRLRREILEKPGPSPSQPGITTASQFHEFMSAVMKESEEFKDRMRSENTKLTESIKSVANEMSSKIEVTNKNLSG
jgi:hypothetical protein